MPYEITNLSHVLKLTLKTGRLIHQSTNLRVKINDSSSYYEEYQPSVVQEEDGTMTYVYTIPCSDFQLGDVITRMEITRFNDPYLWETSEGIVWLVDGEEQGDAEHTNTKNFTFNDSEAHTIEAVYVGNHAVEMATTGKHRLEITEPPIDEEGSTDNTGHYHIFLVDKNVSLTYNDGKRIRYRLTKGGVPIPDRTVEVITPTAIDSHHTTRNPSDKNGYVYFENIGYDAGKYKLGAYYWDETLNKTITTSFKEYTIAKAKPTFVDNYNDETNNKSTDSNDNENTETPVDDPQGWIGEQSILVSSEFVKNSKYKVQLKYKGKAMQNEKITMYVNNKAIQLTTNKYGAVYYEFKSTGDFTIKTVFKGNKNYDSVELVRTITIGTKKKTDSDSSSSNSNSSSSDSNSNSSNNS